VKSSLAKELADRFDELGLRFVEPVDLADLADQDSVAVTLKHPQGRARYQLGYATSLTASSLKWARPHYLAHDRVLLVGPRVTERSAEIFRALGINYIDPSGNAFITFDGVHIDVRGRRRNPDAPVESTAPRMTRGGVNLFSAKRSQVIFALLTWEDMLAGPVRELARTAGVSLGQAQDTLELLEHYGFLNDRRRLSRREREHLIDQWTAGYPVGLGARNKTGSFSGDFSSLSPTDAAIYVSGEAGAQSLRHPETIVLYTDTFPEGLIRANRWRRNEENPNIFLRHKFWTPPETGDAGILRAPWLLVYADLMASHDGRQAEAAQHLRESNA
jgi:hypothetical protein